MGMITYPYPNFSQYIKKLFQSFRLALTLYCACYVKSKIDDTGQYHKYKNSGYHVKCAHSIVKIGHIVILHYTVVKFNFFEMHFKS